MFIDRWKSITEKNELLSEADIDEILRYTKRNLMELKNYLDTVKENKKSKKILLFYREYVELLFHYHRDNLDGYLGSYMYLYNELLVGAKRYQIIENEIRAIARIVEEVGSIT